eukprot:TRINITY_DN4149_c0_g1_i2.p1 TRINITY_DN4149_c0_g1~~TRINITY_DN4149_c0_g1_i2.p1  ORF type:complete len:648 (-),score=94.28 TRINITY_DN4149_c0_g1_i2:297-2240(-)
MVVNALNYEGEDDPSKTFYNHTSSSTWSLLNCSGIYQMSNNGWITTDRYADLDYGSISRLFSDIIKIGSLSSRSPFGAMVYGAVFSLANTEGVLGLSYTNLVQPVVTANAVDDILAANGKNNIFSLLIEGQDGGYLTIGGTNTSFFDPNYLFTVPYYVTSDGSFSVNVVEMWVGSQVLTTPIFNAVLSTTDSRILLPPALFSLVQDYFTVYNTIIGVNSTFWNQFWNASSGAFMSAATTFPTFFPLITIKLLGDAYVHVSGIEVTFSPISYLTTFNISGVNYFQNNIFESTDGVFQLGTAFLQNNYAVFDKVNSLFSMASDNTGINLVDQQMLYTFYNGPTVTGTSLLLRYLYDSADILYNFNGVFFSPSAILFNHQVYVFGHSHTGSSPNGELSMESITIRTELPLTTIISDHVASTIITTSPTFTLSGGVSAVVFREKVYVFFQSSSGLLSYAVSSDLSSWSLVTLSSISITGTPSVPTSSNPQLQFDNKPAVVVYNNVLYVFFQQATNISYISSTDGVTFSSVYTVPNATLDQSGNPGYIIPIQANVFKGKLSVYWNDLSLKYVITSDLLTWIPYTPTGGLFSSIADYSTFAVACPQNYVTILSITDYTSHVRHWTQSLDNVNWTGNNNYQFANPVVFFSFFAF